MLYPFFIKVECLIFYTHIALSRIYRNVLFYTLVDDTIGICNAYVYVRNPIANVKSRRSHNIDPLVMWIFSRFLRRPVAVAPDPDFDSRNFACQDRKPSIVDKGADIRSVAAAQIALDHARELMELLPTAVCFVGNDSDIVYSNSAFLLTINLGFKDHILSAISPEDVDRFFVALRQVQSGGESSAEGIFLTNLAPAKQCLLKWTLRRSALLGLVVLTSQPVVSEIAIESLMDERYEVYSHKLIKRNSRRSFAIDTEFPSSDCP